MEAVLGGLPIVFLRLLDVTLGMLRILMTVRGRKPLATLIGGVEATTFIVAIRGVVRNVDNLWLVLGHSAGFAAAALAGMTIVEKLAPGPIFRACFRKWTASAAGHLSPSRRPDACAGAGV
jgi:uncharacterized protein YebE (UPF0316 family)